MPAAVSRAYAEVLNSAGTPNAPQCCAMRVTFVMLSVLLRAATARAGGENAVRRLKFPLPSALCLFVFSTSAYVEVVLTPPAFARVADHALRYAL